MDHKTFSKVGQKNYTGPIRTTAQEIELIANFYAKEGETDLLKIAIETLIKKVIKK